MGGVLKEFYSVVQSRSEKRTVKFDLLKCSEELGEVVSAVVKEEGKDRLAEELGDLFFCVCGVIVTGKQIGRAHV